jgi:hypothetical protein
MVEITTPSGARAVAGSSFVEWGAVFAGGAIAAALSFVLLTFGSAIGLTMLSPWSDAWASAKTIASIAVFWTMAQQIGSFMVGGYVAGRMRSRWSETTEHEVEFRDGLHGGLVWAVGIVIGAALLFATAGAAARTGAEITGRAIGSAANNSSVDPMAYAVDVLLRPAAATRTAAANSSSSASTSAAPRTTTAQTGNAGDMREEMHRVLARSIANGTLTEADKGYLATIVGQRTGLSPQDAEKRVNDVYAEVTKTTKEAADKARRGAILAGFVTAASLLIGLGAAWWAGIRGGNHRDNSVPARFVIPRPRRNTP